MEHERGFIRPRQWLDIMIFAALVAASAIAITALGL
jgi:hypothetical protein